MDVVD
ncbi:hypothetical protein MIMGU_mgv1a0254842mg, partial [Erythranthe guttata]|jgi:hypothetical protein